MTVEVPPKSMPSPALVASSDPYLPIAGNPLLSRQALVGCATRTSPRDVPWPCPWRHLQTAFVAWVERREGDGSGSGRPLGAVALRE
ncbi:MAG: hypothetical protein AB1486_12055 [Planctomycetota bacterium]